MSTVIQPLAFHGALLRGAHKVENKRDELNRINGFPVPDRDTGSNLAYLMQQLRRQLHPSESFPELLAKLSETSLFGARGNSGAIFSQYFVGFREAVAELKDSVAQALSLHALAGMFNTGYICAYRSIQQPQEGTILSAMRGFAEAFHRALLQNADLQNAAESALEKLRQIVRQTAAILPQQRALRAPDAGAMAFLYFTEGFLNALLGRDETAVETELPLVIELSAQTEAQHPITMDTPFRYCTEVLIKRKDGLTISESVKASLNRLGDSLVISQFDQLARVHLHTDAPSQTVDFMEDLGELLEVKADDMHMQQSLSRPHPGKTALVIDSIADVPEDLLGEDVYCLPLHLMVGDVSFQDKRTISMERMRKSSGKMSSSQLNLEEIKRFLDPILASYDKVMVLTVSSKMSGLHARYTEFVADNPGKKVFLVDSLVNSGAEGLLARHAATLLRMGETPENVIKKLETLRARTKILVSLPDLKAMVASGRLKRDLGRVLMKIGFLPLVTINPQGEGTITGISFSRKHSNQLLVNRLHPGMVEQYALVHANNESGAKQAAQDITARVGVAPEYICEISSVVTNFAGEGAYAVAYIEKESKRKGKP